jgi:hypothetical protein
MFSKEEAVVGGEDNYDAEHPASSQCIYHMLHEIVYCQQRGKRAW